jgi:hypothetical protein
MTYSLLGNGQLYDMVGPEGGIMRGPEGWRDLCGEELDSSGIPLPAEQPLQGLWRLVRQYWIHVLIVPITLASRAYAPRAVWLAFVALFALVLVAP